MVSAERALIHWLQTGGMNESIETMIDVVQNAKLILPSAPGRVRNAGRSAARRSKTPANPISPVA